MIKFDEATHTYTNEDGKQLISVTQLMQKHGLAPNYDAVPANVLKAASERGSLIHKEIEDYNNNDKVGFTKELQAFINATQEIYVVKSEFMLNNDVVAGTADLLLYQNGEYIIADIKTTATLHTDAVAWQLSIYAYLINHTNVVTTYYINKGQAYHFNKDGELNIVDIKLKPVEEVEKLLECERKGEIYQQALATIDYNQLAKLYEVEALIASIENQKKDAENQAKELRAALMDEMQKQGLKSFESDKIKLTIKEAYTRSTIDSAALKKDMPEIAEKYAKTSNVKASLLITLKEPNND